MRFPYVHDLAQLVGLVEQAGQQVPQNLKWAAILSDYAVEACHPGLSEPVTQVEYDEAIEIAEEVIHWAHAIVEK